MSDYTLLLGDALTVLKTLPANSVQCCVTSPPYFGLRDYGTATWEGGDSECDHSRPAIPHTGLAAAAERADGRHREESGTRAAKALQPYRDTCGKCGARRVDQQIGIEATPEQYVAKLVDVFREVRRVLRDDGTLWLNLGSSYASSDTRSNPSRRAQHVPAYGNDGKGLQDYEGVDRAYHDSYGESQDETQSHHDCIAHNDLSGEQDGRLLLPTSHDSGHLDSGLGLVGDVLPGVQESTIPESFCRLPGASSLQARASADPSLLDSYARGVQESAHKEQNMPGKSGTSQTLDDRNLDREPLDSALSSPGDSAALTYLYSTIASLNFQSKQLIPIPWLVALALQADGWILRSEIIWNKTACMPESVTDRPTKAHEQVFLLAKSSIYFYDADAIREPMSESTLKIHSSPGVNAYGTGAEWKKHTTGNGNSGLVNGDIGDRKRNRRSVWTLGPEQFQGSHYAVMPTKLVEPCILAGSKPGDTVLDPFFGSGTVAAVALKHGRRFIGCDLDERNIALAHDRIGRSQPLLLAVTA